MLLNTADKVYVGGSAAAKVYLGSNLVWQPVALAIAAPVFRSSTFRSYPGGSGVIYVDKPAGTVENDILFILTFTGKGAPAMNELVPDTAFNRVGTSMVVQDGATGFAGRLELFWRRMTASEPASYGFDIWVTNNNEYYAASYSGCPTSGSPIDVFSQNSLGYPGSNILCTATGVTTTQANDKLIWFGHNWDASGTLVPPTGMTERRDFLLYSADETIAAAGATGNRTQTQAATNPWGVYLVALKGDAVGGITLDPAKTSSLIALSNGNLTATAIIVGGSGIYYVGSFSFGNGSPKVYAEAVIDTDGNDNAFGVSNAMLASDDWLGSTTGSIGSWGTYGDIYFDGGVIGSIPGGVATGDVMGVMVDTGAKTISFRNVTKGGAWYGNFSIPVIAAGPAYFGFTLNRTTSGGAQAMTARFSSFTGAVPSGYVPWGTVPSGPTSKLLISHTPGPDRNDFSGEVGVRYGIAGAPVTVSWLGMYVTTTGGTRKVNIYEWFADSLVQTVTFDFTGKTVGTWVWMPITPIPMAAGSYYAVMHETTAGDGKIWANALPPSAIGPDYSKVSNAYACYRVPGGGLSAYAENITYVGLDLGW